MNDQKTPIDEKQKRNHTAQERNRPGRGIVGADVPDESKEHHTEIAVEAGQTIGKRHDDKP